MNQMTQASLSAWVRGVVLATLTAVTVSHAQAADWPRFREPNGTGISTDAGIPTEIGESTNLLWKAEIPGSGNSSPIVSKQKIFLQPASNDGLARETKKDFPYVPCMLGRGEHLYFVNDAGIAGCYVAKTGQKSGTIAFPEAM